MFEGFPDYFLETNDDIHYHGRKDIKEFTQEHDFASDAYSVVLRYLHKYQIDESLALEVFNNAYMLCMHATNNVALPAVQIKDDYGENLNPMQNHTIILLSYSLTWCLLKLHVGLLKIDDENIAFVERCSSCILDSPDFTQLVDEYKDTFSTPFDFCGNGNPKPVSIDEKLNKTFADINKARAAFDDLTLRMNDISDTYKETVNDLLKRLRTEREKNESLIAYIGALDHNKEAEAEKETAKSNDALSAAICLETLTSYACGLSNSADRNVIISAISALAVKGNVVGCKEFSDSIIRINEAENKHRSSQTINYGCVVADSITGSTIMEPQQKVITGKINGQIEGNQCK